MSVEITRLPSGLVVVTDAMTHLETASLGVWIGAGSRDERTDEHGISHLLEHMAFKGTSRRTARQIAEEIEAVGGDLNAATSIETTAYYARVLRAHVPLALDVLSDILTDPAFDPQELRREQNVIVQEIGAAEDTPDDLIWDRLQEVAFTGQPIGRALSITRPWSPTLPMPSRASPGRRLPCPSRRASSAALASRAATSSRFILHLPCRVCRSATPIFTACRCSPIFWAGACLRGCSRKCASSADCATPYIRSTRRIPTVACSGFMRGRIQPTSPS